MFEGAALSCLEQTWQLVDRHYARYLAQVNWFVSTAEQIYHQLDSPRHPMDSNGSRLHWDTSRQCLVEAGRYVHRHQATLLLGAKGASLGDVS